MKGIAMVTRQLGITVVTAIVAGAISGIATVWLLQTPPAEAASYGLEAPEFRIVDNAGALRGKIGVDSDGNTRMTLMDAKGVARFWSGVTADGTSIITLRDKEGKPRFFMQVDEKEPLLSMRDANDKSRIYLQIKDQEPLITLRDKNDQGRIFLQVTDQGPVMWFADEKGAPAFTQR
jgi:hypothetical protein